MENIDDPFNSIKDIIEKINIKYGKQSIIIDIHGESTSEKMAIGHFFDGDVNVFGTHTHIPTADLQILDKGTLYQSDLGMCGDYNSVIGMKGTLYSEFRKKFLKTKLEPAIGEGTLCGTIFKINENNKVEKFSQIIKGGRLQK